MARSVPGFEFEVETVETDRVTSCVTITMDRQQAERMRDTLDRALQDEERTTIRVAACGRFVDDAPDED